MNSDIQELLVPLVEETRSMWNEECVALYVHGSAVRGNIDSWSDLDLLLIYKDWDEYLPFLHEWIERIRAVPLPRQIEVDPSGIQIKYLKNPILDYASILVSLKEDSELLLGEDVRSEIVTIADEMIQQTVLDSVRCYMARPYGFSISDPLPLPLPPLEISCEVEPTKRSPAWQISMTAIQILRALLLFETGVLHHKKDDLLPALREFGDEELVKVCEKALQCRATFPRMGPIVKLTPPLPCLCDMIPELVGRLADVVKQKCPKDLYSQFWKAK